MVISAESMLSKKQIGKNPSESKKELWELQKISCSVRLPI
jgi:hypothetical protein